MTLLAQKYRLAWPLNGDQVSQIDEMFEDLYQQVTRQTTTITGVAGGVFYADPTTLGITSLALGTAGTLLRAGTTAPEWSAIVWPNAAVLGDILYASAANTISRLAKDANATRYLSNTGASNIPAWAQVALATGISGVLPYANLTNATAASLLLGRGSAGGAGVWQEITLGSGLTMTNQVLSASSGTVTTWSVLTNGSTTDPEVVFDSFGDIVMVSVP